MPKSPNNREVTVNPSDQLHVTKLTRPIPATTKATHGRPIHTSGQRLGTGKARPTPKRRMR